MPHDKNGELVSVGDLVFVPCVVKSVQASDEYCNASLQTVEPMYPGDNHDTITLNTKQVAKSLTATAEPTRCDCPALDVPHVHEQGGPVALADDAR